MNTCILNGAECRDVLTEMNQIHREVAALHREMMQALSGLATLMATLDTLKTCEESTKAIVTGIVDRLEVKADHQAHRSCPSCGAKIEHHGAEAGDLVICRTCGWSEFVATDGMESSVHFGQSPTMAVQSSDAWTQA